MKKTGTERLPEGAIKRKNFQRSVIVGVPVRKGEHRRHIISSHLMKKALDAWAFAHNGDAELKKLNAAHGGKQALHDKLNNNINNLIAGPGAENTAIGMFTNYVGRLLPTSTSFSAREMRRKLRHPSGFQQDLQKKLTKPAVRIITKDAIISGSRSALKFYLIDLMDSTDFDWPKGAKPALYSQWREAYLGFCRIYNNPGEWSYEGLNKVVEDFLALPRPVRG